MQFHIEQIAIYPNDPVQAIKLLKDLGAEEWAHDHVHALGEVFGIHTKNEADLAFNYQLGREDGKPLEFEVLHYTDGIHWMHSRFRPGVSHLGMHCTPEDLARFRIFFATRGIGVAQEVLTQNHTNPVIAGLRWYQYVIFDTFAILGVDLKFIVRRETK